MMEKLENFEGRTEALGKIIRFGINIRMIYRTNLLLHSKRVYYMLNEIMPLAKQAFGNELDEKKALALAIVHDDAEIITGDIQLGDKLNMTKKELEKIDEDEAKAIDEISSKWPKTVMGYSYRDLLMHALRKDCVEAEIVSYCDKMDAYCESIHEILAGNMIFTTAIDTYTMVLNKFAEKFPRIAKLLKMEHPLLLMPGKIDQGKIPKEIIFYSEESAAAKTGIPQYDKWKEITINNIGIETLTKRIE